MNFSRVQLRAWCYLLKTSRTFHDFFSACLFRCPPTPCPHCIPTELHFLDIPSVFPHPPLIPLISFLGPFPLLVLILQILSQMATSSRSHLRCRLCFLLPWASLSPWKDHLLGPVFGLGPTPLYIAEASHSHWHVASVVPGLMPHVLESWVEFNRVSFNS